MPFSILYVGGPGGDPGEPTYHKQNLTGNGSQTAWTITHNLNSGDVEARLRSPISGLSFTEGQDFNIEVAQVNVVDLNTISLTITPAIPSGEVWKLTVFALDQALG